jgi:two-component system sensor histidine kinase DesK
MTTLAAATAAYPAEYQPRHPVRRLLGAAVWLVVLGHPVREAFLRHGDWRVRALVVLVVSVFCIMYVAILMRGFRERTGVSVLHAALFLAAAALTGLLCLLAGESGLIALVFVGVAAAVLFPRRAAIGLASLVVLAAAATPWLMPGWRGDGSYALSAGLGCMAAFAFVNLVRRNRELIAAREEVIRLTAAEERLRIARDIHDILGHQLTAITVKSELAGRLLQHTPERACPEVADIERLSREALADVRAAVSGYRQVSLSMELASARRTLDAADIAAELPNDVPAILERLPAERRELFGWVIREGVTNVVRHSRARTCRVTVAPDTVEVADDGPYDGPFDGPAPDPASGPSGRPGNGLTGLRERVSRAGGRLTAGARDGGGFLLRVQLPESRSE